MCLKLTRGHRSRTLLSSRRAGKRMPATPIYFQTLLSVSRAEKRMLEGLSQPANQLTTGQPDNQQTSKPVNQTTSQRANELTS